MTIPVEHRRTVRHYDDARDVHELTFSCYQRRRLLRSDAWRKLLAEAMDRANSGCHFVLSGFVFMPEHVHLLVYATSPASRIDRLLQAIKRPYSYRIKQLLECEQSPLRDQLTVQTRQRGPAFRFWEKGPGYDRNLKTVSAVQAALDYIHRNPVTRGLCQTAIEWKWSSARWYANEGCAIDVDLPRLGRLPAEFLQTDTRP